MHGQKNIKTLFISLQFRYVSFGKLSVCLKGIIPQGLTFTYKHGCKAFSHIFLLNIDGRLQVETCQKWRKKLQKLSTIVSRGLYKWRSYASLYPVVLADGAVLNVVLRLGLEYMQLQNG